jgi:hypothetical protein
MGQRTGGILGGRRVMEIEIPSFLPVLSDRSSQSVAAMS